MPRALGSKYIGGGRGVFVLTHSISSGMQFYSGGVFDTSYCSTYDINHAMLVVGYGTYTTNGANKDYWILKNRQVALGAGYLIMYMTFLQLG